MLEDHPILGVVVRLGLAFLLALPLGWERTRRFRSADLRPHALLSLAVCGFLQVSLRTAAEAGEQADAFYGVLMGIGFVGSGSIVNSGEQVGGVRTAVSLWTAGAIGAGAAYGMLIVSAAASLMSIVGLWALSFARPRRATS